ncbi:hypothetical protein ABZP36_012644 [Zizania latifolia]
MIGGKTASHSNGKWQGNERDSSEHPDRAKTSRPGQVLVTGTAGRVCLAASLSGFGTASQRANRHRPPPLVCVAALLVGWLADDEEELCRRRRSHGPSLVVLGSDGQSSADFPAVATSLHAYSDGHRIHRTKQ